MINKMSCTEIPEIFFYATSGEALMSQEGHKVDVATFPGGFKFKAGETRARYIPLQLQADGDNRMVALCDLASGRKLRMIISGSVEFDVIESQENV